MRIFQNLSITSLSPLRNPSSAREARVPESPLGDNLRLLFDVIDFADLNYTWVLFERLIAFDISCHLKRDIDFCNFNKIFGFQELENCNKTDLINCFLLNARFLIYRCKIEKPNQNIIISTINLLKKSE